jgi:hypothetical protein
LCFRYKIIRKFWVAERSKCQVPHIRKFCFFIFPGQKNKSFFVVDDIYIVENVVVEK